MGEYKTLKNLVSILMKCCTWELSCECGIHYYGGLIKKLIIIAINIYLIMNFKSTTKY